MTFIHLFDSNLNGHEHIYVCVVDGVFEKVAGVTFATKPFPTGLQLESHLRVAFSMNMAVALCGYCASSSLFDSY